MAIIMGTGSGIDDALFVDEDYNVATIQCCIAMNMFVWAFFWNRSEDQQPQNILLNFRNAQ